MNQLVKLLETFLEIQGLKYETTHYPYEGESIVYVNNDITAVIYRQKYNGISMKIWDTKEKFTFVLNKIDERKISDVIRDLEKLLSFIK